MSSPVSEPRPRVLVGAAGTATAFGIVRTLRSNWGSEVEIVAVDVNPRRLVASAAIADSYVQSPPVADSGYADWLEATLASAGARLYVPLIDADVVIASELAGDGRSGRALIAAPPLGSARVCQDKLVTYEWLRERGLPGCETWTPATAPRDGELVAKPRSGHGSAGFRRLAGTADLAALDDEDDLVVQALCEPPEVTVDTFLARDGDAFRAICRERLETKAGICTKARVFEDSELTALSGEIVRGLCLSGGSCIQVMRGGDGAWKVTDVNARPGAGTRLSTAAGVDVLGAVYADLLGLPFDIDAALGELDRDVYAVRQFDEYVVE